MRSESKARKDFRGVNFFRLWKIKKIIKGETVAPDSREFQFEGCDFQNSVFPGMVLKGFKFFNCNLRLASFKNSEIEEFQFSDSALNNVNFNKTALENITFHRSVDLSGASFREASLNRVEFSDSDIRGTDFSGAILSNVNFENVVTGITLGNVQRLKRKTYIISAISGIISAYSAGYLLFLFLSSFMSFQEPWELYFEFKGILMIPYFFMFWHSAKRSIKYGIGSYFPVFLLATVLISFLYQTLDPSGSRASYVILGLACFIGAFAGLLAQSQAIYLANELAFLTNSSINMSKNIRLTIAGALTGAVLGSGYQNILDWMLIFLTFIFSGGIVFAGYKLGTKAYEEKEELRLTAENIPVDYSVEQEIKRRGRELKISKKSRGKPNRKVIGLIETSEIITLINKVRRQREEQIYSSIRAFFDKELDKLKTNFKGSVFTNVTFSENTILYNTNFSPALIRMPQNYEVEAYWLQTLDKNSNSIVILGDNEAPIYQGNS